MLTILIFLAVLSVLVIFHEFGHFLMARFFGVKAEEFGLGFPPRAIGFVRDGGRWKRVKKGDAQSYPSTIWSLNWLPLGGFVRLKGEQNTDNHENDSFASKSAWARAWILVAGVLMNWLLAILIFTIGFSVGVPTDLNGLPEGATVKDRHIEITQVVEGSPAAKAGMLPGDHVTRIGSVGIDTSEAARTELSKQSKVGESLTIQVKRDEQMLELVTQPAFIESIQRAGLGIGLADVGTVRLPVYRAIPQAVVTTYTFTKLILSGFWDMLRDLVVSQKTSTELSGPVGIAVMTGKVAKQGVWALAQFAAILSINLAVVNLLPIPALDGGRLVFVFIEVLRRKRRSLVWEARLHQIGFLLLISLIILVTAKDLRTYGAPVWQGIKQFVGL
ncbi:site-2 protease family protein [Patescibacteria group bacterium]|nr:site-2 protease family protein [Patescibacteria group bacterium]MBP9709750.1 site-2 protease family protein [Patescibacteria group bacterium]